MNAEPDRSTPPPRTIDRALLRSWPLPTLASSSDKEARGCVLVIAGSREMGGAAALSGVAAMRAGAGKLVIATACSVAPGLSVAVPEARVIALAETPDGAFSPSGDDSLAAAVERADAVLIGPGMLSEAGTAAFVTSLLGALGDTPVVLDAIAINALPALRLRGAVLITPHAGEMAHLSGASKAQTLADPLDAASQAARRWNAVVALKGAQTCVVTPQGLAWQHAESNPGLATSGSGDALAGLVAGFVARGASLEQAACWGVAVHAATGRRAAARIGRLGFLARELSAEVPAVLQDFTLPNDSPG